MVFGRVGGGFGAALLNVLNFIIIKLELLPFMICLCVIVSSMMVKWPENVFCSYKNIHTLTLIKYYVGLWNSIKSGGERFLLITWDST